MSSYDALARADRPQEDAPEQQAFEFADLYHPRLRRRLQRRRVCPGADSPVPGEAYIHTPFGDRYRLDVWLDRDSGVILRYRLQRVLAS